MRIANAFFNEFRPLLRLGAPLAGSHLAQFSINVTDTVMLGWYGVGELAASVLANALFFMLFLVGSGFAQAVMPMVAVAISREDENQVRRVTRMALWLSTGFALPVIAALYASNWFFLAIRQDLAVSAMAASYLAIAAWGLLPGLWIMVMKSYLSALERTNAVMALTIISAIVNAFLNYVLIFGNFGAPEMGLQGAALASLLTTSLTALAMATYALQTFPAHELFKRFWRADTAALRENFALGWPIGLTLLAEAGLFSATSVMMGWISTNALAAHGIALQFASLAFLIHLGIANAATIRVGRADGKGDLGAIVDTAVTSLTLSILVALISIAVFLGFAEPLISLFLSPEDAARDAVLAIGVPLLVVAAIFQLADGGQVVALGLLRGLQDTRGPMILAAIGYWIIGAPAAYVLGLSLKLDGIGVWLGLLLGLSFAWATMLARFRRTVKQRRSIA